MEQTFNVSMEPFVQSGIFRCAQYDVGRIGVVRMLDEAGEYEIPSGATVTLVATKPSGLGFSEECDFDGCLVTIETTATMTAEHGQFPVELRVESGETAIASARFFMKVEKSAHPDGTTDGTAEEAVSTITALVDRAEAAAANATADAIAAASAEIDEVLEGLPSEVADLKSQIDTLNDGGLILKDDVIAENVQDWLDEHPEATTTVEDGAITSQKLANGAVTNTKIESGAITESKLDNFLFMELVNYYVTPQMYGAKADGTTDDTVAIQLAVDSGFYVVFPKGTYKTTQPITVYSKSTWSMDAENADIVYTGNDFAFKFRALRYSNIRFGTIRADNGGCLYFDGSEYSYWSQYDNFWFKVFRAGPSSACVKAEQNSTGGCWINEMRWHAGRIMRGLYGFYLIRSTSGHNMSHWDFHEIGIEGDTNNLIETGFKFESANDGKVIGSFLFDNCRHEEEFTTLIHTTGPVTKMNFITQAGFPYSKITVDSQATDWEVYCSLYDSFRIINGEIIRTDRSYALDGGIRLTSSQAEPFELQNTTNPLPPGNYFCSDQTHAQTMLNCPTGKQFLLKVEDKGGHSTHAAADYRYLRYRLIDFDDVEYMCTASSNNKGVSWSFSAWKATNGSWIDISSQITWDSTKVTSGSFFAYFNPLTNEVKLCGNAKVTLTEGSNTIGTIANQYRAKPYYTAIVGAWNETRIGGTIVNRTSIRLYPQENYTGDLILEAQYIVY